jgi:hypothetical protein
MCGFIVPSRAVELETPHSAAVVVARPRPASAGRLGQGADPGTTSPLPANVGCGERLWRSCCWCHRGLPPLPQPDLDAIDRSGATRVVLLAALTLVHCVALGLLVASSTDLLQYSTLISLCVFFLLLFPYLLCCSFGLPCFAIAGACADTASLGRPGTQRAGGLRQHWAPMDSLDKFLQSSISAYFLYKFIVVNYYLTIFLFICFHQV